MHVVSFLIKVMAQAAIVALVPGGGILVGLNLYRKYRKWKAEKAKKIPPQAMPQPAPRPLD